MKATLWLLLVEMLMIGGLAFLGGQLMHFGWAVFHILVITPASVYFHDAHHRLSVDGQ